MMLIRLLRRYEETLPLYRQVARKSIIAGARCIITMASPCNTWKEFRMHVHYFTDRSGA